MTLLICRICILHYRTLGIVYKATDTLLGFAVAVKVERGISTFSQLENESEIYEDLKYSEGFPIIYDFNRVQKESYMAMELLGPSLETLFHVCGRQFSLETVCNIGLQAVSEVLLEQHWTYAFSQVDRLEGLHAKGYVHRDLKPANFVIGGLKNTGTIYLIDLGLATYFRTPYQPVNDDDIAGTPLYSSVHHHNHLPYTRRDDLISLIYILLYLKWGSLPWQGRPYGAMSGIKARTKSSQLCRGLPGPFCSLVDYVLQLEFESQLNYAHIRKLLRQCVASQPSIGTGRFDWDQAPEERNMRV